MTSYSDVAALLGEKRSWTSTTSGVVQFGYVVGVRIDERLQTWPDKFNVPIELPFRHRHLVTILGDEASLASGVGALPASGAAPPFPPSGSQVLALPGTSETADMFSLYVKNLRKGLTPKVLGSDFDADKVKMCGPGSAILSYKTKAAAEEQLKWNRTAHKGLKITVMWSDRD